MIGVVGGVAGATAAGLGGVLLLLAGMGDPSAQAGLQAGSVCATSGPVSGLSAAAAANGRIVAATALARGGEPAALISLVVGLAESGLEALPYGDRDSVGIFQQRTPWGSVAQRMDPVASSNLFLNALLKVSGWQSMTPWAAAQATQRSAFADGSNYLAKMPQAVNVLATIKGSPPVACAAAPGGPAVDGLQPTTVAGKAAIMAAFPGLTVGCIRHDANAQDHATGRACDFMVTPGSAQGQAIADFVQAAAASGKGWGAGVQYIIYRQRIWNVDRAAEGWRLMPDRGSPTANHMDHVHTSWK